jgi:hypothetical protein
MSLSTIKKQYSAVVLVLIILAALNIAGFLFLWRPQVPPNTFGGKIVSLSDHSITITDAHGGTRTFIIASSTKIVVGKNVAPETDVTLGAFVMLNAATYEPAATATKIRILSTDPFRRDTKPVTP